jgi:hypothetical protein
MAGMAVESAVLSVVDFLADDEHPANNVASEIAASAWSLLMSSPFLLVLLGSFFDQAGGAA